MKRWFFINQVRKDRHLAIKLRRQNKSYNEISTILNVSKGTLSAWFKNDSLSSKTKDLLTQQAKEISRRRIRKLILSNNRRWERWRRDARQEARKEFTRLARNPLFIAGLMLYWAEGDNKIKNPFRFTNTNPRMIALYKKFLSQSLKIPTETLRPTIILYPDLGEGVCLNFWSKIIGVPQSQFYKTQFIKGKHPTKRLLYGICSISCGNGQLKEKIAVWIDLLSKRLIK